ncbi:hypothetical protein C7212DRAFT_340495 [Tuber magnatum]|uniref:Uncharacterized protein n=1 Tax=Tuber magnatum TaxID=42249 RepID=A0A317SZ97_9PEZI|nr:hypothetical protein C7212DRAFT_340495 [Tuber magnatum]
MAVPSRPELLAVPPWGPAGPPDAFAGFNGDWSGSSEKLPDAYIKLRGTKFPEVVCEAGWAETHKDLVDDARLWLLHTGGETKVVIVLSFTETNTGNTLETENEIVGAQMGKGRKRTAEEMMIESIDALTNFNELAQRLTDLNQQAKLRKPLVRDLKATLHVYPACENRKDIIEVFGTTVVPSPSVDAGEPREFGITLKDVLGDRVPEDQDPMDRIIFSLPELKEFATDSLLDTEGFRATRRAKKLMKETGVWEDKETFAQYKRRRYDPERISK